jgi:FkbM family methyltransferase
MKFMKRPRRLALLWVLERFGISTEVFYPYGVEVHVPKHSDLSMRYNLVRKRPYEVGEARMIQSFLKPGTHVVELGGCVGVISTLIRHVIGPEAQHIVVEADPDLAQVCGANAAREARPGAMTLVNAAVDYSGAKTVRFAAGHNAHVGHIAQDGEDGRDVPTTTLAALMPHLPPDGDAALICDIEGAELALCATDAAHLARFSLIVLETHPDVYPHGAADLAHIRQQFDTAGFEVIDEYEQVIGFRRCGVA